MNSLIVSGGRMDLPFAEQWVESRKWDLVIGVDLGTHFCLEADVTPDAIIGDFDSAYPSDIRHFRGICPERFHSFPAVKDETDTELAVDYALGAGADEITILCGTGSRIDHLLGNVQLLKKAMDAGAMCYLIDTNNRIRMTDGELTLARAEQFGEYVSLIPFTNEVRGLTLTGFVYEAEDITLRCGTSLGVSNRIRDNEAHISLEDGILIVIESRD